MKYLFHCPIVLYTLNSTVFVGTVRTGGHFSLQSGHDCSRSPSSGPFIRNLAEFSTRTFRTSSPHVKEPFSVKSEFSCPVPIIMAHCLADVWLNLFQVC